MTLDFTSFYLYRKGNAIKTKVKICLRLQDWVEESTKNIKEY